ncbi:hypothetical protein EC957_006317 [Mortierella hygrophila]|uniref:Uncharacterized protein n=1 Tax=Mortierella hygrophila TaxID=979708 RepID=A0A9P6FDU2_9FUNG|nr:hypothetical protein EC957_006317 [Mortierella hygrophila]
MNAICAPAHYFHVTACFDDNNKNIFGSTESIMALSRNAHHVRQLALGRYDIIYYVSCVIAFLDQLDTLQQNTTTTATIGHSPALSRPTWLTPMDPKIYTVFSIPPMTMLTKLDLDLIATPQGDGYQKICQGPMATLTQACWIISFNPNLSDLKLTSVALKDRRGARLLMTTLLRLQRLRALYLGFILRFFTTAELMHKVEMYFLSACPPTLRKLTLKSRLGRESDFYIGDLSEVYPEYAPGSLLSWEKPDEECGLTTSTMPRRQGPFLELRELHLGEVEERFSRDDLQSILQQCPNLITLEMPKLPRINDVQQLAGEIVQWCPRLSDLSIRSVWRDGKVRELIDWIVRALPPQQVTRFISNGTPAHAIQGLGDAGPMYQRHSTTLREISLNCYQRIDSKVVQTILVECEALEIFKIHLSSYGDPYPLSLHLEDAIEIPWACTRIQELQLTIAIPERPFFFRADGTIPYYYRPPPTTLLAEETQQFRELESLYRQLGKLTQLQRLDLQALYFDPITMLESSWDFRDNSFPGMLSLGSKKRGRPGYLRLLGELTKLKTLVGSVAANTMETSMTFGMDEVDDAIELPSDCTWIQDLNLTIAIPDEPLHRSEAMGIVPYYNRPSPTTLSAMLTAQLRSLEALYRQLDSLTELKRLNLEAIYFDLADDRSTDTMFRRDLFPGILNLKNKETGRTGYLHILRGLTKLNALLGSVSATTKETRATIGMEEVKWMDIYWPVLERAQFFTDTNDGS